MFSAPVSVETSKMPIVFSIPYHTACVFLPGLPRCPGTALRPGIVSRIRKKMRPQHKDEPEKDPVPAEHPNSACHSRTSELSTTRISKTGLVYPPLSGLEFRPFLSPDLLFIS